MKRVRHLELQSLPTRLADRWRQLDNLAPYGDAKEAVLCLLDWFYSQPRRAYHTWEHLAQCFAEYDDYRRATGAAKSDAIELAVWFHDAIYEPTRDQSEEDSAALARCCLVAFDCRKALVAKVCRLILTTKHEKVVTDPDERLMCDLDLSSLGESWGRFVRNAARIRSEYTHVPAESFRAARCEMLQKFLDRGHIYQSAYFHRKYEAAARANLQRYIAEAACPTGRTSYTSRTRGARGYRFVR